jgi:hypothetical protein
MKAKTVALNLPASEATFTEEGYLRANPDVAECVPSEFPTGRAHFEAFGKNEQRLVRNPELEHARARKLERLLPFLKQEMKHVRRGQKYDFLTEALRAETGIVDTDAVSSHGYDPVVEGMIDRFSDGLLLDCGAGKRRLRCQSRYDALGNSPAIPQQS